MLLRGVTKKIDDDSTGDEDDAGTAENGQEPQLEEACLFLAVMSCLVCCCFASCILRRLRRISGGLSARYLSAELTQPLLEDTDHEAVIGSGQNEQEWKCPVCCMVNPGRLTACDICALSQAEASKRFEELEQCAQRVAGTSLSYEESIHIELSARQRSAARRRRWRQVDSKWILDFSLAETPIPSQLIVLKPLPPKVQVLEAEGTVVALPELQVKNTLAIEDADSIRSSESSSSLSTHRVDEAELLEAGEATTNRLLSETENEEPLQSALKPQRDKTSFAARHLWFEKEVDKSVRAALGQGHARLEVRRSQLLEDSVQQLLALSPEDLRRWMRVQFVDEPGIDVGGLEREWFGLATGAVFANEVGVFSFENSVYSIQQSAGLPPSLGGHPRADELFEFVGRLIGKAILEHVPLAAPLALPLWKQLIGQPLDFEDLEDTDPGLAKTLNWLLYNNTSIDLAQLHLDFSVGIPQAKLCCDEALSLAIEHDADFFDKNEGADLGYAVLDADALGVTPTKEKDVEPTKIIVRELTPHGHTRPVDSDARKHEYAARLWRYHLIDAHRRAVWHIAKGLYAVLPPPLLNVFDAHELELLVCGSRTVDVDDWAKNTDYAGDYRRRGPKHPVIVWFWALLRSWDHSQRSKFLQFCTGSDRVPCHGFIALQRNDGKYQKFSIQSLPRSEMRFPRAHTCFNRLDLPLYGSKQELQAGLEVILSMDTTGFTMD